MHVIPRFGVRAGDLGGYIEHEGNLRQAGDCWIGDNARVFGDAQIYDNAWVYGNAQVYNVIINKSMQITGEVCIDSLGQIYYSDSGITGFVDIYNGLILNGVEEITEFHETLAMEKLSLKSEGKE